MLLPVMLAHRVTFSLKSFPKAQLDQGFDKVNMPFYKLRWILVPLGLFLDLTVISTDVSVESIELHCCSSCECRILLLFCSLEVAMTLPRD